MEIAYFAHVTLLAGFAVVVVEQILKLNAIPSDWPNKHPVPLAIVLSALAALIVTWQSSVQPDAWTDWLVLGGTILVIAAVTYNMTIKNWGELRAMETGK